MAFRPQPLATGEIHREFELDVLAELARHRATLHGCPVLRVESKLDGSIAVWFGGPRDGVEWWEGAIKVNFPLLKDKKWLADTNAIVEATLQFIALLAKPAPLIERAKVH
jgi:hypothetical protein